MHGNRKNGGLNGARVSAILSILGFALKSIISGNGRTRGSSSSRSEPDFQGAAWETIDIMRRRMTL